ncbi:MAG: MarR family transcriptional regulator [Sphingomonadaceae bacterium]
MYEMTYTLIGMNDAPAILVFSDNETGAADMARAVDASGGRIVANLPISEALARLDQQVSMAAVMLDITQDHGHLFDRLLNRLESLARADGVAVLVSAPLDVIDVIGDRGGSPRITVQCEPELADRVSALTLGLGSQASAFADVTAELDSARLRRLADEVSRIARALSTISSQGPIATAAATVSDRQLAFRAEEIDTVFAPDVPSAQDIRRLIRLRRMRESYFDAALFADPAWDMLLDLMAARIEEDRVAVSSLCIAAAVPPTTALRWIKAMTDNGLLERHADPDDGRRIFIRLSEPAAIAMGRYFTAAKRAGGWVI